MKYLVNHDGVGIWRRGQVLTEDDLAGIDVDRLVTLQAVLPTDGTAITPPFSDGIPPVIPSLEDLQAMTYKELQKLATSCGIKAVGKKKDDLIAALMEPAVGSTPPAEE